jgi:putative ABC transport system permease protein
MRIALREGRDVSDADRMGTTGVVVVNESLARRLWPGRRAVGRRITLDGGAADATWLTVVGVTADVVRGEWTAPPEAEVYVPYLQSRPHLERDGSPFSTMSLVVRTAGEPESLAPALRAAVASLDPDVPLAEVQAMETVVRRATARPRFVLLLLASFAVVAATLAAVGLYGVTSYVVAQRTSEIGVRMALGARRGDIARLVVGESLGLVGAGVLVGLAGAAGVARLMGGLLYGVQPRDPATFVTVPLVLAAVALLAAWAPTLRAARTDPQLAMRAEG